MTTVIALDFGGTQLRAARFNTNLSFKARQSTATRAHEGQEAVIKRIITLLRQVWPHDEQVAAIGISAPCAMAHTGLIRNASVVPDWHDVPLAEIVSAAFEHTPVFMENDANLGAVAAYHHEPADPLVYMTISTGIGGGLMIGGRLFSGVGGLAIEPGHLKFRDPDGEIRSLEQFASGPGIARLARQHLENSSADSTLRTVNSLTGQSVGQAAQSGDWLALDVIAEAGYWLGLGLTNVMHLYNPARIVLGGSVMQLGNLILDPARDLMQSQAVDPAFFHDQLLQIAAQGDDICLTGAAVYARSCLDNA